MDQWGQPGWGPQPQPWRPPPSGQAWGQPPTAGPSVGWAVALWVVAAGAFGGALLFGILAVVGFTIDNHMDNYGVTTNATVIEVNGSKVTAEFTTEDDYLASAEFTWWSDDYPVVDDEIEITYNPDDTAYAVAAGSNEDQLLATGFAAGTGIALLVGVVSVIGAVLIHRARTKAARSAGFYY